MNPKKITLRDASSFEEVYVTNNTASLKAQGLISEVGSVNISVFASNETVSIEIPYTQVPINLTEECTVAELMQSRTFRSMVTNGWLEIISSDDAERRLSSPQARREVARIRKERAGDMAHRDNPEDASGKEQENSASVSLAFEAINMFAENRVEDKQLAGQLVGILSGATPEDVRVVMRQALPTTTASALGALLTRLEAGKNIPG